MAETERTEAAPATSAAEEVGRKLSAASFDSGATLAMEAEPAAFVALLEQLAEPDERRA